MARDIFKLSLRYTFHSLKTFSQVFEPLEVSWFWFVLRLVSSSSGKERNLSFASLLWKLGKASPLNSAIVNQQHKKVESWRYALCWLANFYHMLFLPGIDWLRQTVLFFLKKSCEF